MEKWYWIELIGFDNTKTDFGVESFISRANTEIKGISLLFANLEFVLDHISTDEEIVFPPCHASYGGYLHSEERTRQDWTNLQLKGLIKELQKRGVSVIFSFFDFFGYRDKNENLVLSGFINQNKEILAYDKNGNQIYCVSMLKKLNNGQFFEDFFVNKVRDVVEYYNFDGVQFADGISSYRFSIQNGDMSDALISQFVEKNNDSNIKLNCDKSKKDYKSRRDYILKNRYYDWLKWNSERWEVFYNKIFKRFEDLNKMLFFNSTWTRDPFEAFIRYGMDYKTAIKNRAYGIMVEEVSATSPIFGIEDRGGYYLPDSKKPEFHYEFYMMQQSIKAYMPNLKQITLTPIKDVCEQWDIMRHSPMEQERAIFRRNNNYVYNKEKYENCSSGPLYCLSGSMKAEDWAYLNRKEEISALKGIKEVVGFLNVWSDNCLYKEAEYYLNTYNYTQSALKTRLSSSGLCIDGAVRIEDVLSVEAPLLILNSEFYSNADIKKLESVKNKMVIIGKVNSLNINAVKVFDGGELSVWIANFEVSDNDLELFKQLIRLDKTTKCDKSPYLKQGGIWTYPLKYNELPKTFFKTLSKILNKVFNMPQVVSKYNNCVLTTFKLEKNKYRILISNNDYNYYIAKVQMPFAIKKAKSLSKYFGYKVIIDGNFFYDRIPPRSMDIIEIETGVEV